MARAAEVEEGPDAVQALVAQVGANIGGRMEEEYRRARNIVGDLDPEQIADLYVRLKAAIDGDFYVIEVNEERIVLGNHACPFGEAVKHAPGLCRMTSSVFGGIAARNAEGASVVLEERIAVGDPECRVIVWLKNEPSEAEAVSHHYGSSSD
jgi:predicted ArsR family transcriptional regulator